MKTKSTTDLTISLNKKQEIAFFSKANEILYGGGAGGGKSFFLRMIAIFFAIEIPGIQIYLFRKNLKDLVKNHLEGPTGFRQMLSPYVKKKLANINSVQKEISIGRSKIYLCHCKTEHAVRDYQGTDIHILLIDELTHFVFDIYAFLRSRVRCTGLEIPEKYKDKIPFILCGSNPSSIGHNWVKEAFISKSPPFEITRSRSQEGGMLRQFIPALLQDNPHLTRDDPTYKDRLLGMGNEKLVKALLNGDWDIIDGGMFDDVWDYNTHVVEPFQIPSSWHLDRTLDWGSSRPFSVGFWAESDGTTATLSNGNQRTFPRGTLFRIGEIYGCGSEPNKGLKLGTAEVARMIKAFESVWGAEFNAGVADSSIYDVINRSAPSIAQSFGAAGIDWIPAIKAAGTRIHGCQLFHERLNNTLTNSEDPQFYVFNTCRHFIRTVPVLPRDDKRPDDVDTNAEDHCYDEARYRILHTQSGVKAGKIKRGI